MKILDLGEIESPLCLFGGVYSNLQALGALRDAVGEMALICTGDVVGYCADPEASVAELRAAGAVTIAGNVERALAEDAESCGCGFEAGSTCAALARDWYGYARAQVGAETRAWMADLPEAVTFRQAGRRFAVIHGGASDAARFLWPGSAAKDFAEEVAILTRELGALDAVVAGHCGIAFTRRVAGVEWINAGVIGMPPHDGHRFTRYALLLAGQAHLHRLDYDAEAAAAAMRRAGLTQGYEAALLSGWWPSEEILPPELRRQDDRASG